MHLKFLITSFLLILWSCSLAQSPAETERNAFESCKGSETPVQEYDCLSAYLTNFPNGNFRTQAQRRLNELNNVPKNAFKRALEEAQRTNDCKPLERFVTRYAYSSALVREAGDKKNEICPPQDPCAGIRNFNNLYLKQCFDILKNPLANNTCKEKARSRILAIEDTIAKTLRCDNVGLYLRNFPNGRYRAKADSVLLLCSDPGETPWQSINKNSSAALRKFLNDYPNSRRISDARIALRTMDDRLWQFAVQSNTTKGFENYLTDFPDGRYVQKANATLATLRSDRENEEDSAFRLALESGNAQSMIAFLRAFPKTKYKSIAQTEIRRRSQSRHFVQKVGNTYMVELQNMENPRITDLSAHSDSIIVDLSYIDSNQILIIAIEEGVFPITIEDDWNKSILVDINTGISPFNGEMTVQNETVTLFFHNAPPPYAVEFRPTDGGMPIRLEGIQDSVALFSLYDLYSKHALHGKYQVFIEDNRNAYAKIIVDLEVSIPKRYWTYSIAGVLLLLTAFLITRRQLRVRRIRRKMRALR